MYLWFLADPGRLARERAAITQLEQSAAWLVGAIWSLNEGLCIDAVIRVHEHDYHVRMIYPHLFPSVPPIVRPLNAQERWSSHQYGGADGSLCLEWRSDNWHPEVTGAQMLESAYRLLHAENPLGAEQPGVVVAVSSRHSLSIGQELRGSRMRFYVGSELGAHLEQLPSHASGIFKFSLHSRKHTWLTLIHEVQPAGRTDVWSDNAIPEFMHGRAEAFLHHGVFFKTELDPEMVSGANGLNRLKEILSEAGCNVDSLDQPGGHESDAARGDAQPFGVLILDRANTPSFFIVFDDDGAFPLALVRSKASTKAFRTPEDYKGLGAKSVGIVGVGSAGSKMAITLARMGVGKFFLVDHDVFFPENIERHVLDWSHVGDHKVDAVLEVLSRVSASIKVEVSRLHLTGQESTAAVSGVLRKLGQCDLLIDATANPSVFNLVAAVATASQKPLVWMELYAGGMGGMIARSRPGRDPDPQTMRSVYHQYCLEHPAPELQLTRDYAAQEPDGRVLVASDADVSIIAYHAARLAVDTGLGRDPSIYPYSIYLIGLAHWWVFEAPFHTIPIDTEGFRSTEAKTECSPEEQKSGVQFLTQLLEKDFNAASSPS